MAFLNKEEVERYASVAYLDLTGMTWPQKQKAISEHSKRMGYPDPAAYLRTLDGMCDASAAAYAVDKQEEPKEPKRVDPDLDEELARLKRELAEAKAAMPQRVDPDLDEELARLKRELAEAKAAVPQVPVVFEKGRAHVEPSIEDYENAVLIASPEQRPTQFQRGKYYENVGTEKITTDIRFGVGRDTPFDRDEGGVRTATYKVEDGNRPVVAESTMPKYSALLTYRPTKDLVAVAEYGGHRGYLWTHQRLPNVKALLDMMGVYDEYKDQWKKGTGRQFYLGGLLCCDISFTESMIRRIQRQLRKQDESDIL